MSSQSVQPKSSGISMVFEFGSKMFNLNEWLSVFQPAAAVAYWFCEDFECVLRYQDAGKVIVIFQMYGDAYKLLGESVKREMLALGANLVVESEV